ncbi:MAG: purine-nucleoside phosphorylase [Anaerolineales bacterium]|nr:purine-nucleoside phosphorylase [Anaerolineales bacterium]MCB0026358.1 purine-nucleoside phosphorylase [Anaerolineales bacterium]MCB8961270.1 purine-nucleoside phosphorylase [Ardenticatenales bacterium]
MSNSLQFSDYLAAADAIRARSAQHPKIGLVLGSGLGSLADAVENPDIIPYGDIPNWPVGTVAGHSGRLLIGTLEGKTVLVMQGRAHFYEGFTPQQITFPVRVMKLLGIDTYLVTNAAGGMNPSFKAGDLMLIRDHINIPGMAGNNPLRGPNVDDFGPRFPDMTEAYTPALRQLAHQVAAAEGMTLQEGVYVFVSGPNYESPAELRYLTGIGADAVGMSTVPSVLVARHAGMRILGISTITNLALPDPPPGQETTHEEVMETGRIVIPKLTALLRGVLAGL